MAKRHKPASAIEIADRVGDNLISGNITTAIDLILAGTALQAALITANAMVMLTAEDRRVLLRALEDRQTERSELKKP